MRCNGLVNDIRQFFEAFVEELGRQVEMGQAATDSDYVTFQHSINANVKGGAKTRHEILLRQLFRLSPSLANAFDPSIVKESGVAGRVSSLGASIAHLTEQLNKKYAAKHGENLFKATNKTAHALLRLQKATNSLDEYKDLN